MENIKISFENTDKFVTIFDGFDLELDYDSIIFKGVTTDNKFGLIKVLASNDKLVLDKTEIKSTENSTFTIDVKAKVSDQEYQYSFTFEIEEKEQNTIEGSYSDFGQEDILNRISSDNKIQIGNLKISSKANFYIIENTIFEISIEDTTKNPNNTYSVTFVDNKEIRHFNASTKEDSFLVFLNIDRDNIINVPEKISFNFICKMGNKMGKLNSGEINNPKFVSVEIDFENMPELPIKILDRSGHLSNLEAPNIVLQKGKNPDDLIKIEGNTVKLYTDIIADYIGVNTNKTEITFKLDTQKYFVPVRFTRENPKVGITIELDEEISSNDNSFQFVKSDEYAEKLIIGKVIVRNAARKCSKPSLADELTLKLNGKEEKIYFDAEKNHTPNKIRFEEEGIKPGQPDMEYPFYLKLNEIPNPDEEEGELYKISAGMKHAVDAENDFILKPAEKFTGIGFLFMI